MYGLTECNCVYHGSEWMPGLWIIRRQTARAVVAGQGLGGPRCPARLPRFNMAPLTRFK